MKLSCKHHSTLTLWDFLAVMNATNKRRCSCSWSFSDQEDSFVINNDLDNTDWLIEFLYWGGGGVILLILQGWLFINLDHGWGRLLQSICTCTVVSVQCLLLCIYMCFSESLVCLKSFHMDYMEKILITLTFSEELKFIHSWITNHCHPLTFLEEC